MKKIVSIENIYIYIGKKTESDSYAGYFFKVTIYVFLKFQLDITEEIVCDALKAKERKLENSTEK